MKKCVSDLKNCAIGKDVYIVGSGPSMDYYDPIFFKDKFLIGMNYTYKSFPVMFSLMTHKAAFMDALGKTRCVVSDVDPSPESRDSNEMQSEFDYWMFKVGEYMRFEKNLEVLGSDEEFCMGNSIITIAINFAAHIGAACVYLVGIDCCAINGNLGMKGYENYKEKLKKMSDQGNLEQYRQHINDFFLRNVKEIKMIRDAVRRVYGCDVVSVNPFIGLKCEGLELSDLLRTVDLKKIMEAA